MNKMLANKKMVFIFIFPGLLIFFVCVFLPILMSFYYSLTDYTLGQTVIKFYGITNYENLFSASSNLSVPFVKSVFNTFAFIAAAWFVQLPIAFLLAVALAKGMKCERLFMNVYFMPSVIAMVVIGQLWQKIYNYDYGVLNHLFSSVGLDVLKKDWLGSEKYALCSVVFVALWQYIGYHMLLMYAAVKSVPQDIVESARIDGASYSKIVIRIIIPYVMPILETCFIFATVGSLKTFDNIWVITGGGPLQSTESPTTLMYRILFKSNEYGFGSSMAVFVVVECLVFTLFIRKLFKEKYS